MPHLVFQPGVAEAVAAAIALGVVYWAVRYVVLSLGGLTTAWLLRAPSALLVLPLLLVQHQPPAERHQQWSARNWWLGAVSKRWCSVAVIGFLDAAATATYNLGVLHGATAVVASLASLQLGVSVLSGAWLLNERIARTHWCGIACALLGLCWMVV